jgi:Tol biopolymer transport system component
MSLKRNHKCLSGGLLAVFVLTSSLSVIPGMAAQDTAAEKQTADSTARTHIAEVLKGLHRGHSVSQVAVSPDGKKLAWLLDGRDGGGEIRVAPMDNLVKSERVTAAAKLDQHCREGQIAWQPDSKALTFFSDCARSGEQTDLYISRVDGKPAVRLTNLQGYVQAPAFSPDGSKVAFLYVEVICTCMNSTGARIRRGWRMWLPIRRAKTTGGWPSFTRRNWAARKRTPKAILAPERFPAALHGLQIAVPRWSPDGKAIAFIGGLMSDQGSTGGDVWIVSADGGQPSI